MYGIDPDTEVRCVLVTGEGHGKLFVRTEREAYGFVIAKRSMPIFSPYDFDSLAGPQVERVDYRVFGEVRGSKSNQLYRLFCPDRISG